MKMTMTPAQPSWPPRRASGRPMQTVETAVRIDAPCAAVHAFATNAARWPRWHPATRSVAAVPDRPLGLHETVVERITAGGRRFSATWTVVAVEVPTLWVIVTETREGAARITYRLAPMVGAGGAASTQFSRTLEFCSHLPLLRVFDPLMARWVLAPQSRRALDNLKRVVEAG